MPRTSPLPDAAGVVAEAAKHPAPAYLLVGEPLQTEATARALIDALVPPERRSFNLEMYDGRSSPIGPILDSLRTPGLFAGTKVVWVREPALFSSGEKRADVVAALFESWSEERPVAAADRLLALAALAGWTQDRFETAVWSDLGAKAEADLFGRQLEAAEREALGAIAATALERGESVAAHRDESGLLEEFLAAGPPSGNVLVFSAAAVDRRKRVFKALADVGRVVEFTLARERSGALGEESVARLVDDVLVRHGKKLEPRARRLIAERAGSDAALLVSELEKLCLYVGDRAAISEVDVKESMRDLAESWVFDFTRAFAERRAAKAVSLLRALFAQGDHPLRLLALIARELRLLLLARECLADSLAGAWTANVPYPVFRDRLLPRLSEAQREAFGGLHPYALYQCVQNASRIPIATLERALLALHDLDVRFKSSGGDPRILLEAFVLDLCRPTAWR